MRAFRIERHRLGPRVFVLGRRVHDWHLGAAIVAALGAGYGLDVVRASLPAALALLGGLWFVAKDWRDLFPSKRDTASWQVGLHRRAPALREVRRLDSLPPLAALAVAAVGVVEVLAAATPSVGWRGHSLLRTPGVEELPLLHALTLPAALLLFVCALYLWRRRRRACHVALATLVALGVLALVRGLRLEEAAASFGAAAILWSSRRAFHVHHEPASLPGALLRVALLAAGAALVAAFAVAVAAPRETSLGAVVGDTARVLRWQPPHARLGDEAARLPLALELLEALVLVIGAYVLFRPLAAPHDLPAPELRRAARDLVRSHGADTLSFFNLRPDKQLLFSPDRSAFLGYRIENGVLVVSGDPVGPDEALPALLAEAALFAERRGLRLAAIGVGERLLPLYEQVGLRALYLGDEALVETASFSLEGRAIRKVRQSVTRLRKAGFTTTLQTTAELDRPTLAALDAVAERWRAGRPERGFSMAMDSLHGDHDADTLTLVARDGAGEPRGFLHFVPSYGRQAVSLSLMRRDEATPNGLTEFMVADALAALGERGVAEVSLNFAAFARLIHDPRSRSERALGRLVARFDRFFQIESLYRFNAKFFPRWQPRYLLYEGPLALPRVGLAVMWVEGQLPRPRLRRPVGGASPRG